MCTDVRSTEILGKIACKSTVQMKNDDIGTPVAISIKSAREVHSLWNPICSVIKRLAFQRHNLTLLPLPSINVIDPMSIMDYMGSELP